MKEKIVGYGECHEVKVLSASKHGLENKFGWKW